MSFTWLICYIAKAKKKEINDQMRSSSQVTCTHSKSGCNITETQYTEDSLEQNLKGSIISQPYVFQENQPSNFVDPHLHLLPFNSFRNHYDRKKSIDPQR